MNKNEQRLRDEFNEYNILNIESDFIEWLNNTTEFRYCDKCNNLEHTNDLIWLTTDDFTPKENEIVPDEVYEKYDALCEDCYNELIK